MYTGHFFGPNFIDSNMDFVSSIVYLMMSSGYTKNAKMLSSFAYSVFKYLSEQIYIAILLLL